MDLFSHSAMKTCCFNTSWVEPTVTDSHHFGFSYGGVFEKKKKSPQCIYTHSSSHKYEITRSAEQTLIHTDLQDVGSQQ